jgi:PAS domain S-box-containing protein
VKKRHKNTANHYNLLFAFCLVLLRKKRKNFNIPALAILINPMKNQRHSSQTRIVATVSEIRSTSVQKFLDLSPDVFCSINKDGIILDVNAASKTLFGYEPAELMGRYYDTFISEKDRFRTGTCFQEIMNGASCACFENRFVCKGGSLQPMIWSLTWDREEEILYCVGRSGTEKRETETKAKKDELRLQRAFRLAGLGWWEWNMQENTFATSDELYELYGISRREFPSISFEDYLCFVHPQDRERIRQNMAQIDSLSYFEDEHRLIKPNGDIVYVQQLIQIVRDSNNQVTGMYGAVKDITEKKKNLLAVEASGKKLSVILDTLGDGFFAVDRNWAITYLNKKAENLLGKSREYFLGQNFWEIFREAKDLKFYTEYHRAMRDNVPVHFEEYFEPLKHWFELSAYPTEDGLSVYFRTTTEKKKLEEEGKENSKKLKEAEEELHNVLEAMSDGFYTVDRNWNVRFATDKIAAMLSINKEDYIGKCLWDCFPEVVNTKVYTEYHKAFAEGIPVSFEEYIPQFKMWFEINAYPHLDILAVYVKDITQKKNNEKRLQFIARATSDIIWERALDSDEVIISGGKMDQYFGYNLTDNKISLAFGWEKIHPEDRKQVQQNRQQAFENGLAFFTNEYRLQKADRDWAYIKDRTYIVKDESNNPVSLIGAMEDVTNKRLAEKSLVESETSYRQMFENAPFPKLVVDREALQIIDVNMAAIAHYGYGREEFLAMTMLDIRPKKDYEKFKQDIAKSSQNGVPVLGIWTHFKKGKKKITVEVLRSTIHFKGKEVFLFAIKDITEQLRLQRELTKEKVAQQMSITKATIEAQELERTKLGKELHDNINQILTTAKLYIENISYFPEQKEMFIEKGTTLLQKSINEIRLLSKALVTPVINDFGLEAALREMIEDYKELKIFEVDFQFGVCSKNIEKEVRVTIYRIIQEQLNNIVKYARASLVKVHLTMNNKNLLLLIEDNGIGFDAHAKRNGIGLRNIKHRAELFKGNMKIESAVGKGCGMIVTFPVHKNASHH